MKFFSIDRNIAEKQYLILCYIKNNEDIIDCDFSSEDLSIKLTFKEKEYLLFELSRFFHRFKNDIQINEVFIQDNNAILKCKIGQTDLKEFVEIMKKQKV